MAFVKYLITLCLLVLAATTVLAQVPEEAEMNPHPLLFVSKSTSRDDIILGSSVEVIVTVTNYGQSPAFDVKVTDRLENEEKTMTIASIPYGASETLRYTLKPTALGNYPISVAVVQYNLEQGNAATSHTALSNYIREGTAYYRGDGVDDESGRGVVAVLTRERYNRLHPRYVKELIMYLLLGASPALFPYVLYRVKQGEVDALLRRTKVTK